MKMNHPQAPKKQTQNKPKTNPTCSELVEPISIQKKLAKS